MKIGQNNPAWKGGKKVAQCNWCGDSVVRHPSQLRQRPFCSRTCLGLFRASDPDFRALNKGRVRSDEHKEKNRLSHLGKMTGERHPNWISDRSKVKVSEYKHLDSCYKEWMRGIKNRDGWKCKISNGDCSGCLEAHHILTWKDHPELRYEVNNGITLCHFHHPRKREDEVRLSPYFQSLVVNET